LYLEPWPVSKQMNARIHLDKSYHLISKHQYCFEREFAVTVIEQIFKWPIS
jgi:hypothetical protein